MALPIRLDTAPARRSRRHFLSREEILEAAARVLERDGYDSLNMRAIAADLGVKAAALYRYVQSREVLEDLLFDHLMAGCAPAVEGKAWQADLRAVSEAWRSRLTGKRDVTRIALGQVSVGPNLLPLMESALGALRRSGLDDATVLEAYQICALYVHSFASAEATYHDLVRRGAAVGQASLTPAWAATYPTMAAFAGAMSEPVDFDRRFRFGLDTLISGLERRVSEAQLSRE